MMTKRRFRDVSGLGSTLDRMALEPSRGPARAGDRRAPSLAWIMVSRGLLALAGAALPSLLFFLGTGGAPPSDGVLGVVLPVLGAFTFTVAVVAPLHWEAGRRARGRP